MEEQLVGNITAQGGRFLGILDYNTVGAQIQGGRCLSGCGWNLTDWNNSVEAAVEAYPEVHLWELWNEPLVPMFQDGFQNGSAHNYYLMARSAYRIIKAHNSSDTVVCLGGDNIYSPGEGEDQAGFDWASEVWSYGAVDYCDAISLHLYTGFSYLMGQTPAGSYQGVGSSVNQTLAAYESRTGKPIWITEMGIPSNNGTGLGNTLDNSEYKQALFLNQSYRLLLAKSYVRGIFWFNLVGSADGSYAFDFGLLNQTTLAPKPAMGAYRAILNGTGAR